MMAFTFNNYATNELSKSPIEGLISNLLGGYEQGVNLSYLQPKLAEQLQKAQLENKYYGPNMQSQIGLRGAQAGHLGSLTRGQNITNQYLEPKLQAEIDALKAEAEKARLLQSIREQFLTGNPQRSATTSTMMPFEGQGMPSSETMTNPRMEQPIGLNKSGLNYGQAALIQQALGMGMPKISDINGQQYATTILGNIPTGLKGLTEEEKSFQSGLGKVKSKYYEESVNSLNAYGNQEVALSELINSAENNPEFRNVVGPLKKPLTQWFGTPAQKQLLGTLQTSSGEIALTVASSLKGAWTGRDQSMVNSIKAGPNDFPDEFIGKLRAQRLINEVLKNRSELQAQYIEQGKSMLEASKLAAKNTPLEKYKPLVDKLIHPAPNSGQYTLEGLLAEKQRREQMRAQNG